MPSTFQALAVALLALLPGALYELAREQRGGRWGLRGADQIFRLLSFSVGFQVLIAPLTYWLYSHYVVSGHLKAGTAVSPWLWIGGVGYLVVPFVFGRFTAWASKRRDLADRVDPDAGATKRVARRISVAFVNLYTDVAPAPRAWDYLWSRPQLSGWVVLHLMDDTILAGEWNGSYAGGYPEPGDLYLAEQVEVDQDGVILTEDVDGVALPARTGKSLLVRWEEIRYLDFYDATMESEDDSVDDSTSDQVGGGTR
ncbi:DUF6338 family protein [Rhodococcus sp. 1168]|uniref:DUF6338 family protein n=1 Tax=Rhodococcus sp. 1168 TaxID=2018041 RepID=UPI000A0DCEB9|nr:DUF6338 family protein [Rhodococcus sp. 1168]ORI28145.1 hypothetical protein BJI47_00690 [Rhodococcus sp. 1168]